MKVLQPVTITDAMLISHSIAEDDYTAWNSATAYAVGDRCIQNHTVYEALQAGTNHSPDNDATLALPYWLEVSSTNRWRAFDQQVNSQTTATTSFTFTVQPGAINAIGFVELTGSTVRVQMFDGATSIYDSTQNIDSTSLLSWFDYFFGAYDLSAALVFENVPAYLSATVVVTITGTGTVGCGGALFGQMYDLGDTQFGASAGITDYSAKTTNIYGVTKITKRAFSKRSSQKLILDNATLRRVQALLANLRATPCLWIGASDTQTFSPLAVYGYWRDFQLEIAYPRRSYCSLEIEGMI